MINIRFTNLLLSAILLLASIACETVAPIKVINIYCSPHNPAIQFAANDLKQSLNNNAHTSKILSISNRNNTDVKTQIVIGLTTNDDLMQQLKSAGGSDIKALAVEGYAIRLTRKDNKLTVWALGV